MIVTVTMNPAVDRTVSIESLHRGGLNRIQKAESDAGGKGINVSKTLKVLGADSTATGFLAGTAGKKIEEQLKKNPGNPDRFSMDRRRDQNQHKGAGDRRMCDRI